MTYTVLLTGSRLWTDAKFLWATLDDLTDELAGKGHSEMVLRHGACYPSLWNGSSQRLRSADYLAHMWIPRSHPLTVTEDPHPAEWKRCGPDCPEQPHRKARQGITYCPLAGMRRNNAMVALGADLCVAFFHGPEGSRGTKHCSDAAEKAGIHVRRYP